MKRVRTDLTPKNAGDFHLVVEREGDDFHYEVTLPHQCDEWTIAWEPTPREAKEQLENFLEEGAVLLATLKELEKEIVE